MGLKELTLNPHKRDHQRFRYVRAVAEQFFVPGKTALDVGSNDGTFAEMLHDIGYKVCTIDKNHDLDASWGDHLLHDIEQIIQPWPGPFDLVHVGQLLEHLHFPEDAMTNILMMCKIDTTLLVSVPDFKYKGHLRTYTKDSFLEFMRQFVKVIETTTFTQDGRSQFLAVGMPLNDR